MTILLFLLITNKLFLAFLDSLDFFHQTPYLFGGQILDVDNHGVKNANFLEKLYLLLSLEFLYFFGKLAQVF